MLSYGFILSFGVLFILIHARNTNHIENPQQPILNIDVNEHQVNSHIITNDSHEESWKTNDEKPLIRVPRLNMNADEIQIKARQRRQIVEIIQTAGVVISIAKALKKTKSGEEILGMAKKVAIAIIVTFSLCALCCCMITVVVCVRCCGGGNDRRRNQGTIQVPQPIYIHTGPHGYQPQSFQQQAPQPWNSMKIESPENRPMLPQPSAPPRPIDDFANEQVAPPPYEKLYGSN